jgi:hypothetical protein
LSHEQRTAAAIVRQTFPAAAASPGQWSPRMSASKARAPVVSRGASHSLPGSVQFILKRARRCPWKPLADFSNTPWRESGREGLHDTCGLCHGYRYGDRSLAWESRLRQRSCACYSREGKCPLATESIGERYRAREVLRGLGSRTGRKRAKASQFRDEPSCQKACAPSISTVKNRSRPTERIEALNVQI